MAKFPEEFRQMLCPQAQQRWKIPSGIFQTSCESTTLMAKT